MKRHHLHSFQKRLRYAAVLVVSIMAAGTLGMHVLEGMKWLDAFYFVSMIATAQGANITPVTPAGKIFASLLAFISVSMVLTAIGFLVGPLMGKLFKIGFEKYDDDMAGRR